MSSFSRSPFPPPSSSASSALSRRLGPDTFHVTLLSLVRRTSTGVVKVSRRSVVWGAPRSSVGLFGVLSKTFEQDPRTEPDTEESKVGTGES